MTVTLLKKNNKLQFELNIKNLENFLDMAGFYNEKFLLNLKSSDHEIKNGKLKKRNSLTEIVND